MTTSEQHLCHSAGTVSIPVMRGCLWREPGLLCTVPPPPEGPPPGAWCMEHGAWFSGAWFKSYLRLYFLGFPQYDGVNDPSGIWCTTIFMAFHTPNILPGCFTPIWKM